MTNKNISYFIETESSCTFRKSYTKESEIREYLFQLTHDLNTKIMVLIHHLAKEKHMKQFEVLELLFEFGLGETIEVTNKNTKNGRLDKVRLIEDLPEYNDLTIQQEIYHEY